MSDQTCIICMDSDDDSEIIHPCKCTGTGGGVHLKCVETWIEKSGNTHCKICNSEYTGVTINNNNSTILIIIDVMVRMMIIMSAISFYLVLISNSVGMTAMFISMACFLIIVVTLKGVYMFALNDVNGDNPDEIIV